MTWPAHFPVPDWTGNTRATPHQIEWEAETDSREHDISLRAWCECGYDFPPQSFVHPEQAFEAAGELECPHEDEPEEGT